MAKVWKDYPDTTTPITAAELNRIETAIIAAQKSANDVNDLLVSKLPQFGTFTSPAVIPADGTYTATVTFPVAYAAPPFVIATTTESRLAISIQNITETGFTLSVRNVAAAVMLALPIYSWISIPR